MLIELYVFRAYQIICEDCSKEFSSVSTRNRHMRTIHQKTIKEKSSQHVICPLCSEEEKYSCHDSLIDHLKIVHNVNIKVFVLNFRNIDEFETWRCLENREVDYACHRRNKGANGDEYIYYNCNRSDSKGKKCTYFTKGKLYK